jgi:hypothetical protein
LTPTTTLSAAKLSINRTILVALKRRFKPSPWTTARIIFNEYWGLYYQLRNRDKKPFDLWFRKRYDKLQREYEGGKS